MSGDPTQQRINLLIVYTMKSDPYLPILKKYTSEIVRHFPSAKAFKKICFKSLALCRFRILLHLFTKVFTLCWLLGKEIESLSSGKSQGSWEDRHTDKELE